MTSASKIKQPWRLDLLIFLPVLASLVIIWLVFLRITVIEREVTLEHAEQQLEVMTSTLADFNVLAEKTPNITSDIKEAQRAAIWNALLRYPTASIWVESNGVVTAGRSLKGDPNSFVTARTKREDLIVNAALPLADVLADWQSQTWHRCGILFLISMVFLVLTQFLGRALRQRSFAEQKMRATHLLLQEELISRKAAQEALREHDVLLNVVTKGAAELLSTRSHEEAIAIVLALIGNTIGVSWVHLNLIIPEPEDDQLRFYLRYEWSATGVAKMINNTAFQNLNLAFQFHNMTSSNQPDEAASFYTDELPEPYKKQMEEVHMQSFLYIPILIDNELCGSLHFIDTSSIKRQWSWAETDVLKTLASLLGVTITRMRYIKELATANRQAGMAEIANNLLHNVGNVLNSVNVSANLITENIHESKLSGLGKAIDLMHEHEANLGTFFSNDNRGKALPAYLTQLYEYMLSNQQTNLKEINSLLQSIEHINKIVTMQQAYAGVTTVMEMVDITNLIEDSLRMTIGAYNPIGIEVIREFENVPLISLDKHRILQILVNLMNNAEYACADSEQTAKRITLRVYAVDECIRVSVTDNGIGISKKNLKKIFNYGFTTRATGHGFGLHNSVLAAQEMGGSLNVQSDGIGKGATFTLELPLKNPVTGGNK
ncbi:MAG: GAF domain-containing sensor histidine kinase [Pseudomonadota bacterium]